MNYVDAFLLAADYIGNFPELHVLIHAYTPHIHTQISNKFVLFTIHFVQTSRSIIQSNKQNSMDK
jgi:hypothetical protein